MNLTFGSFLIPLVIVAIGLLIASLTDLRSLKIPNILTVPMLLLGVIYHVVVHGTAGILFSTIGLLTGFALLIVFYGMGWVGAGDVKILTASGAWLGPLWICYVFLAASLCLGIWRIGQMTGFSLITRYYSTCLERRDSSFEARFLASEALPLEGHEKSVCGPEVIPYAPNLFAGFLVILLCWYI